MSRLILPVAGTTGGPQRGVAPPRHSCCHACPARLALQPASGTINRQFRRDTTPVSRLDRLAFGHFGDVEPVGKGVSELRIHYGPGYRVYFQRRGNTIIVLLCGGDKGTQARDIQTALQLANKWSE